MTAVILKFPGETIAPAYRPFNPFALAFAFWFAFFFALARA